MAEAVLAVDLGGTRMRAAVVDAGGASSGRRAQRTPRGAECPDALLARAGDVLEPEPIDRAVIGVPGTVDHRAGRLEATGNGGP